MFGNNELDFYLKNEHDEFVVIVKVAFDDEGNEVMKYTTIDNIRAATKFSDAMPYPTDQKFEKIHITSLKYLYYCAKEDLAELIANPRPTYTTIDEIIALEQRITRMTEMLEGEKQDPLETKLIYDLHSSKTNIGKLKCLAYYFKQKGNLIIVNLLKEIELKN